MKSNKAKLLRQLHGLAKRKLEIDNPHKILHQLAVSEFQVESLSHLSEKEIAMLTNKIDSSNFNWKEVEKLGVIRVPQMGERQQELVRRLQKELGWSDDYMAKLAVKRYGYIDWIYLTGREAWAFVNYLIYRKRHRRHNEEESV